MPLQGWRFVNFVMTEFWPVVWESFWHYDFGESRRGNRSTEILMPLRIGVCVLLFLNRTAFEWPVSMGALLSLVSQLYRFVIFFFFTIL